MPLMTTVLGASARLATLSAVTFLSVAAVVLTTSSSPVEAVADVRLVILVSAIQNLFHPLGRGLRVVFCYRLSREDQSILGESADSSLHIHPPTGSKIVHTNNRATTRLGFPHR